jgi:hypothetical protein
MPKSQKVRRTLSRSGSNFKRPHLANPISYRNQKHSNLTSKIGSPVNFHDFTGSQLSPGLLKAKSKLGEIT